MRLPFALLLIPALAGCANLPLFGGGGRQSITGPSAPQPALEGAVAPSPPAVGATAVSAAELDTTTAEEKAAALEAPAAEGEAELGKVVVALGPPAEQGLWLSSTLVSEVRQGRVETADGQSLTLELRPGTGAALLSLAAFQALGLPLTGLPEVTLFGN
jgi:hypothetical protein